MAVVAAVVAFAAHWLALRQQASAALEEFRFARSHIGFDPAQFDELRRASTAVLQAELAVPFAGRRTIWLSHLDRTKSLESDAWYLANFEEPGEAFR